MNAKPGHIYFIGGAPRTGKSTLATRLAEHLALPIIATDDIRAQVRVATPPAAMPALYYLDSLNADEANMARLMREHTAEIIAAADRESAAVWPAVEAEAQAHAAAGRSAVIEGVAVLPEPLADFRFNYSVVHLGNQSPLHAQVALDYAAANPGSWLGSLQPSTVRAFAAFARAYSTHAEKQANRYHQPYLEMGGRPFEQSLATALKVLSS